MKKSNDGQALDRRWWFKEAYQVAIASQMVWGSGLNFQALCIPTWLVRLDSSPWLCKRATRSVESGDWRATDD